jgi:histidyl-tRNA synthetase
MPQKKVTIIEKKSGSKEVPNVKKVRRSKRELSTVTGMRDILPQDQKYWEKVRQVAHKIAHDYGYDRIDTPIVEQADLFIRGVGASTDIVEKEAFSFVDQGDDTLMLRPEGTASVARAYIQHGMLNQTQPVKTFYTGPLFRHEKPQSGRYRQFFQFGFEAIGSSAPALDAQMILMGWNILNDLGIESVIQVNSIGCRECRDAYKKALVKHYRSKSKSICENCKARLSKNPLRVLDCKEEGCQEIKSKAPQILDFLDDKCKEHFMTVVGYLDELNLPYAVNPLVVRGLDYYTKTIFEYWSSDDLEGKNALGGGGRYDDLITLLGGREETPACGLAIGMDRIVAKMREKNIDVPDKRYDVFVAQLGDASKKKAMLMYETLRKNENFTVSQAFYENSLKKQLELANKMKVKFTLILGQKEVSDGTIMLRDMAGGVQEVIDFSKIEKEINKRLERYQEGAVIDLTEGENDEEDEQAEREAIAKDGSQVDDLQ